MALNPVEKGLLDLRGHWNTFAEDQAKRLLIWQAPDNANRMFQCFFEMQKHETEYTTGDVFIVFDTVFENSIQYSRALKEALAAQYDATREDLVEQGITPDWVFSPADFPDSGQGFVDSLRSFGSKHYKSMGRLVAVLMPATINSDEAFSSWMSRALNGKIPERLRLVLIESSESPRLTELIDLRLGSVMLDRPKIDSLNIAQETFAQEPAVGPAGVFRNYLIGLVTLLEKGSADQVKAKAKDAFEFARKNNWLDQQVVVRMLVAGAMLKESRIPESVSIYTGARKSASKAADEGHPAGEQLVLQTWMGEAGAHLAGGDVLQAADCYDQAAVVAQKIPNSILAIESYRMGAFCYARLGRHDEAIERGENALRIGEKLKPEAPVQTTLPLAAIDLLRELEPERVNSMERVKQELELKVKNSIATAEQHAIQMEETGDSQQLMLVETNLNKDTEQVQHEALLQVDSLAVAGGEQFSHFFSRARKLLGSEWPLTSLIVSPPTPAPAPHARSEEVAAS